MGANSLGVGMMMSPASGGQKEMISDREKEPVPIIIIIRYFITSALLLLVLLFIFCVAVQSSPRRRVQVEVDNNNERSCNWWCTSAHSFLIEIRTLHNGWPAKMVDMRSDHCYIPLFCFSLFAITSLSRTRIQSAGEEECFLSLS